MRLQPGLPLLVASLCVLLLAPGALAQDGATPATPAEQVGALLEFKDNLTYAGALENWEEAETACGFTGVTCNEFAHVIAL